MISVILVNWNGANDSMACLQSLLASENVDARFIVVDNKSSDDSIDQLLQWGKSDCSASVDKSIPAGYVRNGQVYDRQLVTVHYNKLKKTFFNFSKEPQKNGNDKNYIYLVQSSSNGGFGFGCNVGMSLASYLGTDVIWLLNNDCVVLPDAMYKMNEKLKLYPNTIFGAILRFYYSPDKIQAVGGGWVSHLTGKVTTYSRKIDQKPMNFVNGASMFFSMKCFQLTKGFDESIFMYFEENDFCLQAEKLGFCFDVVDVDVFHKHGGSQGGIPTVNAWVNVYENKYYVLNKHFGMGWWFFFYIVMLIIHSVIPLGSKVKQKAARLVIKSFIRRW